jgi:hypothetical protein
MYLVIMPNGRDDRSGPYTCTCGKCDVDLTPFQLDIL